MQALVLVGGEGTRLRPLTLTQPKPALQLVDRPFLRYVVDWLARHFDPTPRLRNLPVPVSLGTIRIRPDRIEVGDPSAARPPSARRD